MYQICFVIVWMGKFPEYFKLWMESCRKNSTINFLMISDQEIPEDLPGNILYKKESFADIRNKFKKIFDFEIHLEKPYKLCDYKPAYGLIFQDLLKSYDFWGYCDLDMIWGDIRKYITDEKLNLYDKLYVCGHCTLFRNNEEMVHLFMKESKNLENNYKIVYTTGHICHFDEGGGVNIIAEDLNINVYDGPDLADIDEHRFEFRHYKTDIGDFPQLFEYDEGKLFCDYINDNKVCRKEYMYMHFQKRIMKIKEDIDLNHYMILPDGFRSYCPENIKDQIIGENKRHFPIYFHWYKERAKIAMHNLRYGAIKRRYRWIKEKIVG